MFEGVMEVGEEGDYIPVATLSPPERLKQNTHGQRYLSLILVT